MNTQLSRTPLDVDFTMPAIPSIPVAAFAHGSQILAESISPEQNNTRLEQIISSLLTELGVNVQQQHFRETPRRVARLYRDLTRGYQAKPGEILKTFTSEHNELVVVSGVTFQSLCPHHMLIYRGRMDLGYIPNGKIVGLSKIPRLIHALAARLIVQEELVAEVADAFMRHVQPLGCVVRATGKHDCVAVRGVRAAEASMTTIVPRGIFREQPVLMDEFHRALAGNGR